MDLKFFLNVILKLLELAEIFQTPHEYPDAILSETIFNGTKVVREKWDVHKAKEPPYKSIGGSFVCTYFFRHSELDF